jgi:hypothetical protein
MPQIACPVSQRPAAKSPTTNNAAMFSNTFVSLLGGPDWADGEP